MSTDTTGTEPAGAVAVAGLALRVPGAADPATFWANLLDTRITLPGNDTDLNDSDLTAGQIDRFEEFDHALFGLTPAQAAITDPQHRVLLELAWEALEDAGIDTQRAQAKVGVFVGCGPDAYLHEHVLPDAATVRAHGPDQIQLGNSRDLLAAGLSYRLGLTGPSLTVQTACSTSLVAVHQAIRALLTYECDVAIAGAATVHPHRAPRYRHTEGGIVSPDGRCRSFTQGSSGTVPASGAGLVVLRRSGEGPARAHLLGSAVNNDGADRLSLTAPSSRGQAEVLREALEVAGAHAAEVGYIETHGTGTVLGDEVELAALNEVYAPPGDLPPCTLGSVKPNIGHCDTAAGVLGLIKTVLALQAGVLPPTPGQPGDGPDLDLGPRFRLTRRPEPWTGPPLAAVSSFGLGGTNAHVLLAPPTPAATPDPDTGGDRVAVLSAATPEALTRRARTLATHLATDPLPVPELLGALWHGRRQLRHRWALALPADDTEARTALRHALPAATAREAAADPVLGVVLPGQGVPLAGTGAALRATHPGFAADLDALHETIRQAGGPDLSGSHDWPATDPRLRETAVVQPLLFALGLAALRLLAERGVRPAVLLGHSIGELTAATHAGVFTVEAGAAAAVRRGAVMAAAAPGVLLAVRADETLARELVAGLVADLCGLNAPDTTVLGADPATARLLVERCAERGVQCTRLDTGHAFHSRAMTQAALDLTGHLRGVALAAPGVPVLSNLTGGILTAEQATDPGYWGAQLRGTVRLADAVTTLLGTGVTVVLGLHRGPAPTNPVRQAARLLGHDLPVADLFGGRDTPETLDHALGTLWAAGCPVRLDLPRPQRPVRLPAYPFAPTRHWIGATATEPAPEDPAPTEEPTDTAAVVAGIWQDAFGGPTLRGSDNFFTLGGTSLQAAHLITLVNQRLPLQVRLSDLYQHSGLAAFTARIDELLTHHHEPATTEQATTEQATR